MVEPLTSNERLVAMVGKGGTGKTAFTSMMTKVLVESGRGGKLLLIDADPAMGLPLALGVHVERTVGQAREKIIITAKKGKEEEKQHLAHTVDYLVMEALNEMDGFAMLAMGRTDTLGCYCPVNDILRSVIETFAGNFDTILIDGEAGLEQGLPEELHLFLRLLLAGFRGQHAGQQDEVAQGILRLVLGQVVFPHRHVGAMRQQGALVVAHHGIEHGDPALVLLVLHQLQRLVE